MKLLFIRQNYPPETGAVRYIRDLAEGLAARGHQPAVITGLPNYPLGRPYPGHGRFRPSVRDENGVRVYRVPLVMAPNRRPLMRLLSFLSFPPAALPAALLSGKPDIVICSVPPVPVAPLGLAVARLFRVPLVMMLHDFEPLRSLELRGLDRKPAADRLIRLCTSLYTRAERIVVTIESELEALNVFGAPMGRVEVIRHGVDLRDFSRAAERDPEFCVPRRPGRHLALYLGTLGVAHDVEKVIELFALPAIRLLPFDLAVVGDGECAPLCAGIVSRFNLDNVRLLPPAPLEAVPALLRQADLLVMSQKPDLFSVGSKFYECLAAGRPILANSTGILARTIERLDNGWVFDARVPESLEKVLHQYLGSDHTTRDRMRRRSWQAAAGEFSADSCLNRWENLLCRLVHHPAKKPGALTLSRP